MAPACCLNFELRGKIVKEVSAQPLADVQKDATNSASLDNYTLSKALEQEPQQFKQCFNARIRCVMFPLLEGRPAVSSSTSTKTTVPEIQSSIHSMDATVRFCVALFVSPEKTMVGSREVPPRRTGGEFVRVFCSDAVTRYRDLVFADSSDPKRVLAFGAMCKAYQRDRRNVQIARIGFRRFAESFIRNNFATMDEQSKNQLVLERGELLRDDHGDADPFLHKLRSSTEDALFVEMRCTNPYEEDGHTYHLRFTPVSEGDPNALTSKLARLKSMTNTSLALRSMQLEATNDADAIMRVLTVLVKRAFAVQTQKTTRALRILKHVEGQRHKQDNELVSLRRRVTELERELALARSELAQNKTRTTTRASSSSSSEESRPRKKKQKPAPKKSSVKSETVPRSAKPSVKKEPQSLVAENVGVMDDVDNDGDHTESSSQQDQPRNADDGDLMVDEEAFLIRRVSDRPDPRFMLSPQKEVPEPAAMEIPHAAPMTLEPQDASADLQASLFGLLEQLNDENDEMSKEGQAHQDTNWRENFDDLLAESDSN
ncbi:MAG: hypothetical protein MHM6MM_003627 [Cercozoa sp. M6MM]